MTDEASARVCPRCGANARNDAYCSTCGLHLVALPELPTRAEWEAGEKQLDAVGKATGLPANAPPQPDTAAGSGSPASPSGGLLKSAGKRRLAGIGLVTAAVVAVLLVSTSGGGSNRTPTPTQPTGNATSPFGSESPSQCVAEWNAQGLTGGTGPGAPLPQWTQLLQMAFPNTYNVNGGVYAPADPYVTVEIASNGQCEVVVANPNLGQYQIFYEGTNKQYTMDDSGNLSTLSGSDQQWNASISPVLFLSLNG